MVEIGSPRNEAAIRHLEMSPYFCYQAASHESGGRSLPIARILAKQRDFGDVLRERRLVRERLRLPIGNYRLIVTAVGKPPKVLNLLTEMPPERLRRQMPQLADRPAPEPLKGTAGGSRAYRQPTGSGESNAWSRSGATTTRHQVFQVAGDLCQEVVRGQTDRTDQSGIVANLLPDRVGSLCQILGIVTPGAIGSGRGHHRAGRLVDQLHDHTFQRLITLAAVKLSVIGQVIEDPFREVDQIENIEADGCLLESSARWLFD